MWYVDVRCHGGMYSLHILLLDGGLNFTSIYN